MQSRMQLESVLRRIDGRGYKAYKDIEGTYDFGNFILHIDHVQGDPFASPSRIRVVIPQKVAGFPQELYSSKPRKKGLEDFLTRQISKNIPKIVKGNRGTGKSGQISIISVGQEILNRTSVLVSDVSVEARLTMGLPARGRTILSGQAMEMLFGELPRLVEQSLIYRNLDRAALLKHVNLAEDQWVLRSKIKEMGLVAFVANGSILPRRSGVDDRPMESGAVPFKSPPELEVMVELPHAGKVWGMGIPKGITLIVGGGYHGKSTLLRAIERGVYDHIPGDGRELVVTVEDAVKIRAEDGRRVEKVDISPFINNLPNGEPTTSFSTENASGSTSQAANIMEALEIGTSLLLIDEDTSATNFMIRDARMQRLVHKDSEPITPFIDRVEELYEQLGVSTIIVVGGSGDYFDVAHRIIMMENYVAKDVTAIAKAIAQEYRTDRKKEGGGQPIRITQRIPIPHSLSLKGRKKIKSRGLDNIQYGHTNLVLDDVEQLVDVNQTRAIGDIIRYAMENYMDGKTTLREIIQKVCRDIDEKGLDVISPFKGLYPGDYAQPRPQEIGAAINRLRILKVKQESVK
ncbi:MAG: ABC-ATPase domain-containing protein [Caldicoprobacter sp.]|uniref:ABC-ATPase domain-containing protein n=1 Tax=Caldicoprobacter sp. TaxID=2004500 RepID=UPI0039C45048